MHDRARETGIRIKYMPDILINAHERYVLLT